MMISLSSPYEPVATNVDQPQISKRRVIILLGAALLALAAFVAMSDTGNLPPLPGSPCSVRLQPS